MAREKGMGCLQREKSGRWTMRVCIHGKRYSRSTRTKDRDQAERVLQRFLAPLGLGERRLPLADVWLEYVKSPNRNELAKATLEAKRIVWMHFAKWMERNYLHVDALGEITAEMVAEYLACLRADLCGSTYNGRVCVLREIFRVLADRAGLEDDPWKGVRLRPDDSHSRRELTMDELRRLLEAAKRVGGGRELKLKVEVEERRAVSDSHATGVSRPLCEAQPVVLATREHTLSDACSRVASTAGERDRQSSTSTSNFNSNSEWYILFLIGIYTGLRLGDCCRLDWSNVNLGQGVIQVIPQKTKRHAHGRPVTIPIHPTLGAALVGELKLKVEVEERRAVSDSHATGVSRPLCEAQPVVLATREHTLSDACSRVASITGGGGRHSPTPTLNSNCPTGPVLPMICEMYEKSRCRVSDELAKIFKAANITMSVKIEGRKHRTPEATFHSLRHTFVSFAANAGIPLHFVQSIVGHESTAMTRHYYHEDVAGLRRAVAAIPAFESAKLESRVGERRTPSGSDATGVSRPPCEAQPVVLAPREHTLSDACSRVASTTGRSAVERLGELEALKAAKAITEQEYKDIRARILAEL